MLHNLHSIKILLAEDFKITRKMETEALNEIGFHNIIEADDGKSAIRVLRDHDDVGLIISDWNMPDMNGYEFLLQIRSDENFKNTPFIMATAQGEKAQAAKAIQGGADHFITKPFTPPELKEIIEEVFSRREKASDHELLKKPSREKTTVRVAHIQITDHLVLGVLNHLTATGKFRPKHFDLEMRCMSGWNPVQRSLEKGEVDAAFILAPLAMDLFSCGVPLRLVLFSHRNGSICVRNRQGADQEFLHDFLKSKTFYLPHTMSIHHMLANMFLREIGLKLGPVGRPGVDVFFEVIPPVRMPDFLKENPDACGFVVAEPFGTKAISAGISDLMFLSGEMWENHPCCVVAMSQDFTEKHTDAVYEFIHMLIQAGEFIDRQPEASAQIALEFLDPHRRLELSLPLLESILSQSAGIKTDDLFPVIEDLDRMQRYMKEKMNIGNIIDLEKFTDTRFAEAAYKGMAPDRCVSTVHSPGHIVAKIISRQIRGDCTEPAMKKDDPADVFRMTKGENSVSFQISSDMKLVSGVVQETKLFLRQLGLEAFSGLNLILRELLNNAVEHGNENIITKQIFCNIVHMRDSLFKITVTDQGDGFDYTSLDMSVPEDKDQVRKRGYPFINAFSDEIEFSSKGNQVTVYHTIYQETHFDTSKKGDQTVIRPSGDITAAGIDKFRSVLKKLLKQGHVKYSFDFSKVRDIDSVGLSAFIVLSRMLSDRNTETDLEIVNAGPEIADLFRMTHLDESYRIEGLKIEELKINE